MKWCVTAAIGAMLAGLLLPATGRAEDPVAVLVTGPLTASAGEKVSFEVEIVNRSQKPLSGLRIIDYFDKGLRHEASSSPIEQKAPIDLATGTSRRITLEFIAAEPGRQCHRVEILDPSHVFVGGATACVQVSQPLSGFQPPPAATTPSPSASAFGASTATPTVQLPSAAVPVPVPTTPSPAAAPTPSLELSLKGPPEIDEGAVAEFIATVRNTGSVASLPGSLDFTWDQSFSPREASDGYKFAPGRVSWAIPAIGPGEQLRRQVNLQAESLSQSFSRLGGSAARPCVKSTLAGTGGGVIVADESCVLLRSKRPVVRTAREAGLRVALADCDDPVRAGTATLLVCTLVNDGVEPIRGLEVSILLPDQAQIVGDPVPSRTRIDRSTVTFEPVATLPPGSRSTFQVAYRVPTGGTYRATALASSTEIDGRVEASCSTTVLGP